MSDLREPDPAEIVELLQRLPRVKITPETITQNLIDQWYERERNYRAENERLADFGLKHRERAEQAERTLGDYTADALCVLAAKSEALERAEAAIERVRKAHARVNTKYGKACDHCRGSDEEPMPWPCPTIAALDQPTEER